MYLQITHSVMLGKRCGIFAEITQENSVSIRIALVLRLVSKRRRAQIVAKGPNRLTTFHTLLNPLFAALLHEIAPKILTPLQVLRIRIIRNIPPAKLNEALNSITHFKKPHIQNKFENKKNRSVLFNLA